MKIKLTKVHIILLILIVLGFAFRAYPHLFLIPQWSPEEEYNYMTVKDLILTGSTRQVGFYPILEHYTIFGIYKLFGEFINSVTISQYFNPLFGALTIIPIFLLIRKLSNTNTALITSLFWTFSEASFYRTAIFSSTEILAFFVAIFALYFYTAKKYVPTAILIGLTFYIHLLPAIYTILVIFIHQFFTRSIKVKILSATLLVTTAIFLFSPLNPHQRLITILNPATILSHFNLSNILLYSFSDLIFGFAIFAGTVTIAVLTLINFKVNKPQKNLVLFLLLVAIVLFVFSWVIYSPNLFAPPRLTLYFIIPLSFYTSILINKFNVNGIKMPNLWKYCCVIFISIIMISSTFFGSQTMLFYQNSPTKEEYKALDELQVLGLFNIEADRWWSDYPIRVSITTRVPSKPTLYVNETEIKYVSNELANQSSTLDPNTSFKYVYFSERMEKESFFLIYTDNRTQQIRTPLTDIWSNSTLWNLIYYNYGVKVYEHT